MLEKLRQDKKLIVIAVLMASFTGWWLALNLGHQTNVPHKMDGFLATYALVALVGGIWGLKIAKQWGGWHTLLGRAIMVFSLGLLAQVYGQLGCAYYAIVQNITVPYPSFADVGYFGSGALYAYGTIILARIAGVTISPPRLGRQIICLLMPLATLALAYIFFLDMDFTARYPLATFFNLGNLLNEAIYMAFVLLILLQSRHRLGGIMRSKMILLLFAPLTLHVADLNFFWQASRDTLSLADYGDLIYVISYGVMSVALLSISTKAVNTAQHAQSLRVAREDELNRPRVSERLRHRLPKHKKQLIGQIS